MNVLEAYNKIKEGKIVRISLDSHVYFILETILTPFNEKNIVKIALSKSNIGRLDEMPKDISDIPFDSVMEACIDIIISEEYEEVSVQEMMSEIQNFWRNEQ